MWNAIQKYKSIIHLAIPSLIAISTVEIVNIQVYLSNPISQGGAFMLFLWISLQMIPGFFFGYISDHNYRKPTLIICQLLGVVGGLILLTFGFEFWVLILIALTFNPLPVARAALLDHFPQYSTVKLVAITYIAQYFPWMFFAFFSKLPNNSVVLYILGILFLNIILTMFLFKDKNKKEHENHETKTEIIRKNPALMYTLIAFVCAEAGFYLLWAFFEYNPIGHVELSTTNLGTIFGIGIAMLYTRLPHISIITLFYSIGAVVTILAFLHCFGNCASCSNNLFSSMNFYCIIGGLYLPFVTDGVIRMLGARHKAFSSALIELGDTVSAFFAPFLNIFIEQNARNVLISVMVFYIAASLFQKRAELHVHR